MCVTDILMDGFYAAIAAIGFGAISDPPMRAFPRIAVLAALGHALRFCLMSYGGIDIATASFAASFFIGMGSLWLGAMIRCPMTVLYIPALLPMIPGMYAYKIVLSLILFMQNMRDEVLSAEYMSGMFYNIIITASVIFMLAVGATIPIFLFRSKAHSLTRGRIN